MSFPQTFPPGRKSQKTRKQDVGRFLTAHKKPEQQSSQWSETKETLSETRYPGGIRLDGRFLLQLHDVDEAPQLCSVDICEQNLTHVEPEELKAFVNVGYLDASDNFLSLGSLSCFKSLREINLSFNRISKMVFEAAEFPHVEVLDLSYNCLPAEDFPLLGQIPRLKTLHLTGNRLRSLPPGLGASSRDQSDQPSEEGGEQFKALETLMLDDNRLTSGVFYSLVNLKRLKHLNLQGNHISEIPCVESMESLKAALISALRRDEGEDSKADGQSKMMEFLQTVGAGGGGSHLLLPELLRLSLADNKVSSEEALLAAAVLFPKLSWLDVHSNPLTTHETGVIVFYSHVAEETSLLTRSLQERLGIQIRWKKAEDVLKLPQAASNNPGWEHEENTPNLSQRWFNLDAVRVGSTLANKSRRRQRGTEPSEGPSSSTEAFFVTQTEDEPAQNNQGTRIGPEQTTSHDMIMDAEPLPYIGIQTAVRMLERTLRNPIIYRDSKPRLDSIQTPYREIKKRTKELPPLRPTKPPGQRVEELIKEIKDSTTVKVVALGSAVGSRALNREDYREAVFLLKDMKKKHRLVHQKLMEGEARAQFEPCRAERPPL